MTNVERLVNEWLAHDKIILAVDFDDTIFPWKHNSQGKCDIVIEMVKWVKSIGAYIMIHTASDKDRYEEIIKYCNSKNLQIDSINENPIDLPYGKEGKPYYNWQLCDRSGLESSLDVLEKAAKIVITEKRKNNNELNYT